MLIYEKFPGDSMRIARLQFELYTDSLEVRWDMTRRYFEKAESVVGIQTELGRETANVIFVNPTSLQTFHDELARFFRYEYCIKATLFEEFPAGLSEDAKVVFLWREYLRRRMRELLETYPNLARNILMAALFQSNDSDSRFQLCLSEITAAESLIQKALCED